jgi:TusA-related sulfurtransferase
MIFQYDAINEKCPLPLVNLRLILKKMKEGDVCVLKIQDSGSKADIPKLLTKLGYCYNLGILDNGVIEFTITT